MTTWGWIWAVSGGVAVLTFAALELTALATRGPRSTLSSYLRRWLGLEPRRDWWIAGVAGFIGFLVWLGAHVTFGILPG